jgi:hypothetical protein
MVVQGRLFEERGIVLQVTSCCLGNLDFYGGLRGRIKSHARIVRKSSYTEQGHSGKFSMLQHPSLIIS